MIEEEETYANDLRRFVVSCEKAAKRELSRAEYAFPQEDQ